MSHRTATTLCSAVLTVALITTSALAQEQPVCGPEIKQQIAEALTALGKDDNAKSKQALEAKLYDEFSYCAADAKQPDAALDQYCGKLVYSGSTFYESMPCCGYDPQKQLFACPVEIRQTFGFGPAHFPGSYEYVMTCVDFGGGVFQPVASDGVHLADEIHGARPNWYFAVIARASGELPYMTLKGQTLLARSILSWGLKPNDCNYKPIWGNVIDYQIRLDP